MVVGCFEGEGGGGECRVLGHAAKGVAANVAFADAWVFTWLIE